MPSTNTKKTKSSNRGQKLAWYGLYSMCSLYKNTQYETLKRNNKIRKEEEGKGKGIRKELKKFKCCNCKKTITNKSDLDFHLPCGCVYCKTCFKEELKKNNPKGSIMYPCTNCKKQCFNLKEEKKKNKKKEEKDEEEEWIL